MIHVYFLALHDQADAEEALNIGMHLEIAEDRMLDGVATPFCPLKSCGIDNHRMELVSHEEYERCLS